MNVKKRKKALNYYAFTAINVENYAVFKFPTNNIGNHFQIENILTSDLNNISK